MFDFEIINNNFKTSGVTLHHNDFKLTYIFEPLNKPKIIELLKSDMKLILLQQLFYKEARSYEKKNKCIYKIKEDARYYYKVNSNTRAVESIIKKGKLLTKEKVTYLYNDSLNPSNIRLKHKGLIRLRIELNNLPKTAP
jgi:hypothetical protein